MISSFCQNFMAWPGPPVEATYMKLARLPQGPTLTFRVDSGPEENPGSGVDFMVKFTMKKPSGYD